MLCRGVRDLYLTAGIFKAFTGSDTLNYGTYFIYRTTRLHNSCSMRRTVLLDLQLWGFIYETLECIMGIKMQYLSIRSDQILSLRPRGSQCPPSVHTAPCRAPPSPANQGTGAPRQQSYNVVVAFNAICYLLELS